MGDLAMTGCIGKVLYSVLNELTKCVLVQKYRFTGTGSQRMGKACFTLHSTNQCHLCDSTRNKLPNFAVISSHL